MCEYCGCRQIEPLAELMDEHLALLDEASDIETALGQRDHDRAVELLRALATRLDRHVRREEDGVFTAMKETGEFVDEVLDLEQEHHDFDAQIAALDPAAADFADRIRSLFAHLSDHIDREDLGIFPVSVVTLGARGWDTIARVHDEQPSFLARPTSH
jgi:hemerythrin-like domain-containing protein